MPGCAANASIDANRAVLIGFVTGVSYGPLMINVTFSNWSRSPVLG